jgi:hypothetical protein
MNEAAKRQAIDRGTLVSGIILIGLGGLFLLSELEVMRFGHVVRRYWPMIIVLVGLPKLFSRETVWSGLWLIAVGVWLQISHLGLFGLSYGTSWPLLLIALGGGMILRSMFDGPRRTEGEGHERRSER